MSDVVWGVAGVVGMLLAAQTFADCMVDPGCGWVLRVLAGAGFLGFGVAAVVGTWNVMRALEALG